MNSRHRRGGLSALLAAVAVLVALTTAATASAATPYGQWRSGGDFVPYGKATTTSANSIVGFNYRSTFSGSNPVWVTCAGLQMSGSVENPGREHAGLVSGGPTSMWHDCELVEYGQFRSSESSECHIGKELPAVFQPGELEVVNGVPRLRAAARISFTVECPKFTAPWVLELSGTGNEVGEGAGQFSLPNSQVRGINGVGVPPGAEAQWGVGFANAAGPISAGVYTAPEASQGSHWFLGGAKRSAKEGQQRFIKEGSPLTLTGGTGSFVLESVQSGLSTSLTCADHLQGTVENPAGGGPGVANVTLAFGACQFGIINQGKFETRECAVQGSGFTTRALAGTVTEPEESYPTLTLSPSGSNPIGEFTVSGCKITALNHSYVLTGKLKVKAQMSGGESPGEWHLGSLNSKSAGSLFLFGQLAGASGSMYAEVGGEVVTMG
jgi:hypothetical protein